MSGDDFERAADALSNVVASMDDVDLNVMLDEDVRRFMAYKRAIGEMCRRYRHDQHAQAASE